jgi:hypothetical protein
MFPHWMFVMFSWANHICGRTMLFMSLDPSVIVSLGGHLYRIPEVVATTVPPKKCRKVVSHTAKFSFFTICSEGEQKDTETTTTSPQAPNKLDPGGYRWPPTFSNWLKTVFWQFWQFTIFSRF